MHRDCPVGLHHGFPYLREDDIALWPDQVIMTFGDMRTYDFNVQEGLSD